MSEPVLNLALIDEQLMALPDLPDAPPRWKHGGAVGDHNICLTPPVAAGGEAAAATVVNLRTKTKHLRDHYPVMIPGGVEAPEKVVRCPTAAEYALFLSGLRTMPQENLIRTVTAGYGEPWYGPDLLPLCDDLERVKGWLHEMVAGVSASIDAVSPVYMVYGHGPRKVRAGGGVIASHVHTEFVYADGSEGIAAFAGQAWLVQARIEGLLLRTPVVVTPQGDFLCSVWCQHVVSGRQDGTIGLEGGFGSNQITPEMRLSLPAWLAGPGRMKAGLASNVLRYGQAEGAAATQTLPSDIRALLGAALANPILVAGIARNGAGCGRTAAIEAIRGLAPERSFWYSWYSSASGGGNWLARLTPDSTVDRLANAVPFEHVSTGQLKRARLQEGLPPARYTDGEAGYYNAVYEDVTGAIRLYDAVVRSLRQSYGIGLPPVVVAAPPPPPAVAPAEVDAPANYAATDIATDLAAGGWVAVGDGTIPAIPEFVEPARAPRRPRRPAPPPQEG